MAWLEEHPTSGRYKICFRWGGRKLKTTLKTKKRKDAEATLLRFEENINLLERGRLDLPPDADVATFLLSDGKLTRNPKDLPAPQALSLGDLRDRYIQTHSNGAIEQNSLDTVKMHLRHFVTGLGESFAVQTLNLVHLQRHVDRRSRKKGIRNRPISPTTLRKEMASLRACWNWGVQAGLVKGPFPNRGLRYPKADEKPPFQTWQEIERQIQRGGPSDGQQQDLWDCLFLTMPEIAEFLAFVKDQARHIFFFPMVCFAAHTGARRSEMLRCQIGDVDLEGRTVILHEKKRAKGKRTMRRVPLSDFLCAVLHDWLANHPGGQYLFCHQLHVAHSKKRRSVPVPLTRNEAHDQFKRAMADSKWAVLRGWHVLRHSFASNCAAKGIDQRLIDEWMGHQTEEMRRRYRHLFPDQQRQAIELVFGGDSRNGP